MVCKFGERCISFNRGKLDCFSGNPKCVKRRAFSASELNDQIEKEMLFQQLGIYV